jgi:hypothetical protein
MGRLSNSRSVPKKEASAMVALDFASPLFVLFIRVPDTNAVQESSVIRRIDCRLGVWQIR